MLLREELGCVSVPLELLPVMTPALPLLLPALCMMLLPELLPVLEVLCAELQGSFTAVPPAGACMCAPASGCCGNWSPKLTRNIKPVAVAPLETPLLPESRAPALVLASAAALDWCVPLPLGASTSGSRGILAATPLDSSCWLLLNGPLAGPPLYNSC
jgi:hypothetical protein